MYCPKCGTQNKVDSNFCVNCGSPLTKESNVSSTVDNAQTLVNADPNLMAKIENCNTLIILGLVFAALNFIPYIDFLTAIVSFILTIIGMNKVIAVTKDLALYNENSQNIETTVRRLRLHYILSSVLFICSFGSFVASLIASFARVYAFEYDSAYADYDFFGLSSTAFALIAVYCIFVHIWCLVRWFTVKEYLNKTKNRLTKGI